MSFLKRFWLHGLMLGIICILLFRDCTHSPEIIPGKHTHTTDTVYIEKPFIPKKIEPNNQPVKVKVYKQKDPALRDSLEKEPIIEAIEIKKNSKGQVTEIDITKVDSSGLITTDIHKLDPDSKKIEIDNTGQVEEKKKTRVGKILKKTWKGIKTGFVIAGGVAIAILTIEAFRQ
jgi:hypothetical protein